MQTLVDPAFLSPFERDQTKEASIFDVLKPLALALVVGAPASWAEPHRMITVTGEGEVEAAPDMATLTLGVTEEDAEAVVAMDAVTAAMGAVLERLAAEGIEARDLQTRSVQLHPVWANRSSGSELLRISGYQVSNTVMVRARELAWLGAVMDAVLRDEANRFDGLSFGLANSEALTNEAQQNAVADALAKAAGGTLRPMVSISEAGIARPRSVMMEAARSMDAVPVAAGELTVAA